MLARQYRLTDTQNFEAVQGKGEVFQYTNFGVAVLKREAPGSNRFGFIVSNKIAGNASDRNRIKRAMREAVRTSQSHSSGGFDVVFLAKMVSSKSPTNEIMREVGVALNERGLTK